MPATSAKNADLSGSAPGLAAADMIGAGNLLQQQRQDETEEQRRRRLLLQQMREAMSPLGAANALQMGTGRLGAAPVGTMGRYGVA